MPNPSLMRELREYCAEDPAYAERIAAIMQRAAKKMPVATEVTPAPAETPANPGRKAGTRRAR